LLQLSIFFFCSAFRNSILFITPHSQAALHRIYLAIHDQPCSLFTPCHRKPATFFDNAIDILAMNFVKRKACFALTWLTLNAVL
jgi:hypothetical protein